MEDLVVKYMARSISMIEIKKLEKWLEEPINEKAFNDFVKINYSSDLIMNQFSAERTKVLLSKKIKKDKNVFYRRRFLKFSKYAAVSLVFLTLGYVYYQNPVSHDEPKLEIEQEHIVLQLEDGKTQIIYEDGSIDIIAGNGGFVAKQQGKQLNYTLDSEYKTLVYNELFIPYGKQFQLTLSDGTLVHLNAGSSLKYPVKFLKEGKREVFLSGEAYFEIAEDKAHPFVVNTNEMAIQALGTQFNVSSYAEDISTNVVLVHGAVGLSKEGVAFNGDNGVVLVPGEKGEWDKIKADFSVQKVNTYQYTSWRKGELIFRKSSFKQMLTILGRHYNVQIVNTNTALEQILFNASFKKESLENVLLYFNDVLDIKYVIENNIVIIK